MTKNQIYISVAGAVLVAVVLFFILGGRLTGKVVLPYTSHQKPVVDPHLPGSNELSDKLDEVSFEGLFNISANPSGIVYEDGLGKLVNIDKNDVVTIKLNLNKKWHDSYNTKVDGDEVKITQGSEHKFTPEDLAFTLQRIQRLGSLSPDYILVSQALKSFTFDGPDAQGNIRFYFKGDRIWKESDIKEVLSFKILPSGSSMNAASYNIGTADYLTVQNSEGVPGYYKLPDGLAVLPSINLKPYVDNSTYETELNNDNINVLLNMPFGAVSPVLSDDDDYFYKSSISTTFFAVLFNTQKLDRAKRVELRKLLNNEELLKRFYKVGTEQQKNIVDYKENKNNYNDYLNYSVFPSTTYYVEEEVVYPTKVEGRANTTVFGDTIRIKACTNFGHREEYNELIEIMNDPALYNGKVRVTAVDRKEIANGNYDALLIAFDGYKSNFLFDLYDIFLRDPDMGTYKINMETNGSGNSKTINTSMVRRDNNFCRLDPRYSKDEAEDIKTFTEYVYGFMSTNMIGDKQEYAYRIDQLEHKMALGAWLFSVPSLSYFSSTFDSTSIDLYGVASQLSTIEKWKEAED